MEFGVISVDYRQLSLSDREKFSFTKHGARQALQKWKLLYPKGGAVLLSTCNRTELYVSMEEPMPSLREMFQNISERVIEDGRFQIKIGEDALRHLFRVACGLESMILCDDQIVSQTRQALDLAREEQAVNPYLETAFRLAVTAAKQAKTEVFVRDVPPSAAGLCVQFLKSELGSLQKKKVLVIGNGEMGRLCARFLQKEGAEVTVTLRTYHHGVTIVPDKCKTISYEDRFSEIAASDVIVSATVSPHFTVSRAHVKEMDLQHKIFVDLAVPRDIDPTIDAKVINIDDLGGRKDRQELRELEKVHEKIAEGMKRYQQWKHIKEMTPLIEKIAVSCGKRAKFIYGDQQNIQLAAEKSAQLILMAVKDFLTADLLQEVEDKITQYQKYGNRSLKK
ncbi:MAG: glutamyl-tRNA reductase [Clostridiales bacterium]|nr:glutamyl-tRNA reductase [Clostridiales bacterium]